MEVQTGYDLSTYLQLQRSGQTNSGSMDFQTALADARRIHAANETSAKTSATSGSDEHDALVKQLDDYLKKSPVEHMRDAILRDLNLTEADLAALPPEERNAIESMISQMIKEKMLEESGVPTQQTGISPLLMRLGMLPQTDAAKTATSTSNQAQESAGIAGASNLFSAALKTRQS